MTKFKLFKLDAVMKLLIVFVFLFALSALVSAQQISPAVENLEYSCTYQGQDCPLIEDITNGVCRTMHFEISEGIIKTLVCKKEGIRYELYLQEYPVAYVFDVCVGAGCISNQHTGYSSFTSEQIPAVEIPQVEDESNYYIYEDPSIFETTCNYAGEECEKTHDEVIGACRTVSFMTQDGSLVVLLCHKDDSRYELYRVIYPTASKSFLACIGPLCVDEWKGFDSYSIRTNDYIVPEIPDTITPEILASGDLMDGSLSVDKGIVAYDRVIGDNRYIVWGSSQEISSLVWLRASKDGTLQVTKTWQNGYFGEDVNQEICINIQVGSACVNPVSKPLTQINSTNSPSLEETLSINIYPGMPIDQKAVFECVPSGFAPDLYAWEFGDGTNKITNTFDVYHNYPEAGEYNVTCFAGGKTASMNVNITVPFSPSLITGEQMNINSTLTVGGSSNEKWGTYLELISKTEDSAVVRCAEIGHRANITKYPSWGQHYPLVGPNELSIQPRELDRRISDVYAPSPGNYTVSCAIGVSGAIYYGDYWNPDSPLFHNGLPAFGWGTGELTGYSVTHYLSFP